jgi:hypothetical protein
MHNSGIVMALLINETRELYVHSNSVVTMNFFIQGCSSHRKYRLDQCGHDKLVFHECKYNKFLLNEHGHDKRLVKKTMELLGS